MCTCILFAGLATAGLAACGGSTVIDPGGTGGAASATSTTNGTSNSSSSGSSACTEAQDCPEGSICIYAEGVCVPTCSKFEPCGQGLVCNGCAGSSCPECLDCVGGCLPAEPGTCDDHDDCQGEDVCIYSSGQCAPPCGGADCADPTLFCDDCATSSCPACEDCTPACVQI